MLNQTKHFLLSSLLLLGLVSSGGCATTPQYEQDPFENFNRGVFAFNEGVDKLLLKPVAETYKAIMPDPVDQGVSNFFSNLNDMIVISNDVLQFKFKQAASDTGRFLVNSTVGLLGVFDIATHFGMPKHDEDFGQTLGYWGVGSGPYLILPFFGPSTVRDTIGLSVDILLDPRVYYASSQGNNTRNFFIGTNVIRGIDARADLLDMEKVLQVAALDKYSYLRDAYLARREYLIYDGNPPKKKQQEESFDEEDLFDDLDLEEEEEEVTSEEELTSDDSDETDENQPAGLSQKNKMVDPLK